MKRIICTLLVIALAVTMAPVALAAESGTCGKNAFWTLDGDTLTISGTGTVEMGIMDSPWRNDQGITRLVVEEGITGLGSICFGYIPKLKKVSLPDSLQTVANQVFQGCDSLEEITLPKNLQHIDRAASSFSGENLKAIYVHPENTRFYSDNGVLIDRAAGAVLCYPMGKTDAEYTVPDGIREIGYGAFWHCLAKSIVLPEGLKIIGDSAFFGADFSSMVIPGTVTAIGEGAFENCDALTEITIPESVKKIDAYAFASCQALETITVLNPDCTIAQSGTTLENNTTICGYEDSTAQAYARTYGRDFVDILTGQRYAYDTGNSAYMALLPAETGSTYPSFNSILVYSNETGDISGYQPNIVVEQDTDNATYQEMLAFVRELTADCVTDYEKAREISRWVGENMTYVFGMMGGGVTAEGVYAIWKNLHGNCEGYTQLTNFLLHLVGISTATVTSYAHTWTAAFLDGRWVMVDSTNQIFDAAPDTFDDIERICFAANDNLVCVIDDLSGVKLASYGPGVSERTGIREITIPGYVTHIYKSVFAWYTAEEDLEALTIHGTAGSYAETYIKENLPGHSNITYQDGLFSARVPEAVTLGDADDNGKVDNIDAMLMLQYFAGLITEERIDVGACDVDGNGVLNNIDAMLTLQRFAGLLNAFPAEKT